MLPIIEDGYTEEFYIAAVPRLHDSLSGTFRPMLTPQRDKILRAQMREAPSAHKDACAGIIQQVKSWDAKGKDGNPLPLTASNVERLRPQLLDKLFNIVIGQIPSDVKPDAEPGENPEPANAETALKN